MQPGPVARGIIFRNPGIRNIPEHLDVPFPEPAAKHPVVYPEPFRRVVSQRELRRVLLHPEGMQGDRNPGAGAAAFAHRDLLPADVRAAQSARNKGYEESQMVEDERDVLLPEMRDAVDGGETDDRSHPQVGEDERPGFQQVDSGEPHDESEGGATGDRRSGGPSSVHHPLDRVDSLPEKKQDRQDAEIGDEHDKVDRKAQGLPVHRSGEQLDHPSQDKDACSCGEAFFDFPRSFPHIHEQR